MHKHTIFLLLILMPAVLWAQGSDANIRKAEKLHAGYDFAQARSLFESALEKETDSLKRCEILEKMAASDNGLNMLSYAVEPQVVTRRTVPRKDFFLNYSHLKDRSWIPEPNAFVPDKANPAGSATYLEPGAKSIIFSAPDEDGIWNIYTSTLQGDSLWSAPAIIESVSSTGSDIFPMLSPDGKSLYFSSDGLYGMGGYDLYVSHWDDGNKCWGAPENLGFPYSSPFDDLLFCDTPDGNYSVFASNRDCDADNITIYVLKFENSPIKKPVTSTEKARQTARLLPSASEAKTEAPAVQQPKKSDSQFLSYRTLLTDLRSKGDAISSAQTELQKDRSLYETLTDGQEKKIVEQQIRSGEATVSNLQREMVELSEKLQELETEFLLKGVFIDISELEPEATASSDKAVEPLPEYTFARRNLGKLEVAQVAEAVEKFDYNFKIGDKAVIVEDRLPDGLVYQIQLFVSNKAPIAKLKGISPVYERRQSSGKYLYAAGLFRSYKDASSNLGAVRRAGFSDALIIAFNNGKSIALKKARDMESTGADGKYGVVLSAYPSGIPADIRTLISDNCSKDIVKSNAEGAVQYIVAPFYSRGEADSLAGILIAGGVQGITVEKID